MRNVVVYARVPADNRDDTLVAKQQAAVREHMSGHDRLVAQFIETETRSNPSREHLQLAISAALKIGATLAFPVIGRLVQSPRVLRMLIDSGLHVLAADMPDLYLGDLPALLEHALARSALISARTRRAIADRRGDVTPHGSALPAREEEQRRASVAGAQASRIAADQHAERVIAIIDAAGWRGQSRHFIARALNDREVPTARGGRWYPTTVSNLFKRESCPPAVQDAQTEAPPAAQRRMRQVRRKRRATAFAHL